jgi:hypothetical protein
MKVLVWDGELSSRFENVRRCRSSDLFDHAKKSIPDLNRTPTAAMPRPLISAT